MPLPAVRSTQNYGPSTQCYGIPKKQISFGPNEPDLSTQLKGLLTGAQSTAVDIDMYCLNRAYVQGYISEEVFERGVKALIGQIQRTIAANNQFAKEFPLLSSEPSALYALSAVKK